MTRTLRSLGRLFAIARTLARHGALAPFSEALANAGLAPLFLFLIGIFFGRQRRARPGQRLAHALAELGPAFIKFGQVLSTRSDLLGEEVARDLAHLQDRLPAFPAFEAHATIEAALGAPVDQLYRHFDDEPVSAASISQVHFAVTSDGRDVAVKVLRPGIEQRMQRDIELLFWVAGVIERTQPRLRRLKPVEVVKTFAATLQVELDLRLEAAAAAELAHNFRLDSSYHVPAIDWRRTARRVMTQERLAGIRMDDRSAILEAGLDIRQVLERAAAIFFNQAFRDGYFHGDQHPGNMFVLPDGSIGAVDFGIMGRLDRKTRYYLADMLLGFLEGNYARVAAVHVEAGYIGNAVRLEDFTLALRSIGEPIRGRKLHEISFARLLGQLFSTAESFEMEVQPQLLLLQKNMLMAEGISRQLDPELNIWTLAQPLIEQWMRENRGPEARLIEAAEDTLRTLRRFPSLVASMERMAIQLTGSGLRLNPEVLTIIGRRPFPWSWVIIAILAIMLLFWK
ncbi:MAG TPA: 2-polyprenylphenol 6-hydroxylase [Dongiaceae bacterium]|jgi:ubiquinone biosynthesis protein|nr:2-polyprenylphenol 6-hydroxylase [Dongiaceae bacterium]